MFSIKKKLTDIVVSTVLSVSLFIMPVSAAEHIAVGTVSGNVVNVREGASTNNKVITTLAKNAKVDICETADGWVKVEYAQGKFGYMCSDYVDVTSAVEGTITGSVVNVRAGAGTEYDIIGKVYAGQTFTVVSRTSDFAWTEISYNGLNAYVSSDYIFIDQTEENADIAKSTAIIDVARRYLGKPYVYGCAGPNAFDCSGFTSYVYGQLGYSLNRTAAGQYSNGIYVSKSNLKPGDLVMFGRGGISHVGIYIGDNKMIHAQNAATGVCITSLSSEYYASNYVGARRIV